MKSNTHLLMFPEYNVEDIDWSWRDLLSKVKLSDGTPLPVMVEAQDPEAQMENIPCVGVRLVTMVPDYMAYEGWNDAGVGFTYDANGLPMHEVRMMQPEHYILQYEIFALSSNPLHDRELVLKVGAVLTPRPVLILRSREPSPVVRGFQQPYKLIADRSVFEDRTRTANEQRLYERVWLFNVPVDLPHPEVGLELVARVTEWHGVDPFPEDSDDHAHGTILSIKQGPADPENLNEFDLPMDSVDLPDELRYAQLKVEVTEK